MKQQMKSAATLRIIGDDLVPEDITRILGCEPTSTAFKGQIIRGKNTGHERIARTGSWHLEVPDRMPDDLEGQITEIVSRLNPYLDVWATLANQFRLDLFCGLFMAKSSEGLSLSPAVLRALGERHLELNLCIYDSIEPEDDENSPRTNQ